MQPDIGYVPKTVWTGSWVLDLCWILSVVNIRWVSDNQMDQVIESEVLIEYSFEGQKSLATLLCRTVVLRNTSVSWLALLSFLEFLNSNRQKPLQSKTNITNKALDNDINNKAYCEDYTNFMSQWFILQSCTGRYKGSHCTQDVTHHLGWWCTVFFF